MNSGARRFYTVATVGLPVLVANIDVKNEQLRFWRPQRDINRRSYSLFT